MKAIKAIGQIILLAVLLVLSPLVGLVSYPVDSNSNAAFSLLVIEVILATLFVIAVTAVIYWILLRKNLFQLFKDNHWSYKVLLYAAIMIGLVLLMMLASGIPHQGLYNNLVKITGFGDPKLQYFFIIISGVLAPIAEELYFRGLIFTYVRNISNVAIAIIMSSIFFGLAHSFVNPYIFISHAVVSIFIGLARQKSNGMIVPIIMHMIWNLLIFALIL
ncbi:CPBP family intramembrane glutamic endopeptidase [Apilactobacillus apinorum]|uniref:CAAX prenyl protease 2/Lysostaphin resistance protein A-like domain-containing protein n=1 Tax=Apilactobacillus apinorum TaxID=1218495 RepID=A0ABP9ZG48_9LACO